MPSLPKWMANAMEKLFSGNFYPVQVSALNKIAETLLEVEFVGDFTAIKKQFTPGHVIEFRVSDTEFRHYTPSFFDAKRGICRVIFYLHQKGVGSHWATNLYIGEQLKLIGLGDKMEYQEETEQHIVFGDETALGLMKAMVAKANQQQKEILCLVELDKAHYEWCASLELPALITSKNKPSDGREAAKSLHNWLTDQAQKRKQMAFYLTGNVNSIKTVRKTLSDFSINRQQIQTFPYWVEGKKGL